MRGNFQRNLPVHVTTRLPLLSVAQALYGPIHLRQLSMKIGLYVFKTVSFALQNNR